MTKIKDKMTPSDWDDFLYDSCCQEPRVHGSSVIEERDIAHSVHDRFRAAVETYYDTAKLPQHGRDLLWDYVTENTYTTADFIFVYEQLVEIIRAVNTPEIVKQ